MRRREGGVLCAMTGITSNTVMFPSMIVFFLAYNFCFDLSVTKKLFCFANAAMICAFSTTYTTFPLRRWSLKIPVFFEKENINTMDSKGDKTVAGLIQKKDLKTA